MDKKLLLTSLLYFFISNAYAITMFQYKIRPDDTFSTILKKFVKDTSVINANTPFVKKTRLDNPQIKDWANLVPGTVLTLSISDEFIDSAKYKNFKQKELLEKKAVAKRIEKIDTKNRKNTLLTAKLKASVFIMSSLGAFKQKASGFAEIQYIQDPSFSLGVAFSYLPKDKLYSFSFFTYLSFLRALSNNLSTEKVSIPPEVSANLHAEYRFDKIKSIFSAGVDYESFSAFNLQKISATRRVYADGVNIAYITAGIGKSFLAFNKPFYVKTTVSKSILSSYTNKYPSATSLGMLKYQGERVGIYLNYKINEKFYIHSLIKYHSLSGSSKLTATRVGVGFGYLLF